MDKRKPSWFGFAAGLAFLLLICFSTLLLAVAARAPIDEVLYALRVVFAPIAGLLFGAGLVLFLIDRINRRDGNRNPNLPPDPP